MEITSVLQTNLQNSFWCNSNFYISFSEVADDASPETYPSHSSPSPYRALLLFLLISCSDNDNCSSRFLSSAPCAPFALPFVARASRMLRLSPEATSLAVKSSIPSALSPVINLLPFLHRCPLYILLIFHNKYIISKKTFH